MLSRFAGFVVLTLGCLPLAVNAAESRTVKIIEPNKNPQAAKPAMIDTEKFQAGFYFGTLNVEDFNSNPVAGLSVTYQLRDDVLLLFNHGRSDVEKSTFEKREKRDFMKESDRELTYNTISGGYKLFTARSFLGPRFKYDSDVYLIAGLGRLDYAGKRGAGISFGASYRVVFTDWMVATLDFRNHMYEMKDVIGLKDTKTSENLELSFGFNALF